MANIPRELLIFLISALPIGALRVGIPLGLSFDLNPWTVFALAVLGNPALQEDAGQTFGSSSTARSGRRYLLARTAAMLYVEQIKGSSGRNLKTRRQYRQHG